MNVELKEAASQIQIPDMENGITKNNEWYFELKKEPPRCLRGKMAPLQLSLMLGCFFSSFLIKENSTFNLLMVFTTFFLCLWYLYDARYVSYYKKAAKALMFGRYRQVFKYLTKILESGRVYIEDMPLAYNVLKAKEMLLKNDIQAAEYLAENALKTIADCPEAVKIREICREGKKTSV